MSNVMMCTSERLGLLFQLAEAGVITPAESDAIAHLEVRENMKRFEAGFMSVECETVVNFDVDVSDLDDAFADDQISDEELWEMFDEMAREEPSDC